MRTFTIAATVLGLSLLLSATASAQGTGMASGGGGGTNQELPQLSLGTFSADNSSSAFGATDRPGASTATTPASTRNTGGGQFGGGFGGAGGGANLFSQLFGGQSAQGNSTRRVLRAPLRAEFSVIRPEASQVASGLASRLTHIGSLRNLPQPLEVQVVDRVATLRGQVDSVDQKELAERMARLEPGVSSVINEIVVAEKSAN